MKTYEQLQQENEILRHNNDLLKGLLDDMFKVLGKLKMAYFDDLEDSPFFTSKDKCKDDENNRPNVLNYDKLSEQFDNILSGFDEEKLEKRIKEDERRTNLELDFSGYWEREQESQMLVFHYNNDNFSNVLTTKNNHLTNNIIETNGIIHLGNPNFSNTNLPMYEPYISDL